MTEKYYVNEIVRFNYSDIGEYIDEYHIDGPLRNDILVELLNKLNDENAELHIQLDFLKDENRHMRDLVNENEQLKKELKRCKDWINSDKNDYELILSFIKNKGYSLKDVLEYEKELSE